MSKKKRRKNRERDELSFLADSLNLHGRPEFDGLIPDDLPPPALDSDANKKRGPAEATTIRQKGDPELSAVLAEAISHSGKIDRTFDLDRPRSVYPKTRWQSDAQPRLESERVLDEIPRQQHASSLHLSMHSQEPSHTLCPADYSKNLKLEERWWFANVFQC